MKKPCTSVQGFMFRDRKESESVGHSELCIRKESTEPNVVGDFSRDVRNSGVLGSFFWVCGASDRGTSGGQNAEVEANLNSCDDDPKPTPK